MEDFHRNIISHNIEILVVSTEYNKMKKHFLNENIMTPVMIQNIESDYNEDKVRLYALYKKLPHRGPDAFQKFMKILIQCDYKEIYNTLNKSVMSIVELDNKK